MYEDNGDTNVRRRVSVDGQSCETPRQGSVVERLSKYGIQVMPSAAQRRTALKRQQETDERSASAHEEAPERASITTAMRKKYLKELLLTNKSHSGFSSVLSSQTNREASCEVQDAGWALSPTEHAWMLAAVEGNYDTLQEFLSEDPYLLTRRDFISGYTVLHWLAKRGQDECLLKLLSYAQTQDLHVNVNVRGSGGLTPLHLASMTGQYMVIKLLVGAFGANVDAMDYNGKRAWQYLKGDAPVEIRELLGTWDDEHWYSCTNNVNKNNNCTVLLEQITSDAVDGDAEEGRSFERTSRSSLIFGSVRKLLLYFTSTGNNDE